ncbi:integrase catalytic domain-containing protein [Trichonephila clavipes]|nr:integrase catalytic domain-containing protein [Trichonephila clavipes]
MTSSEQWRYVATEDNPADFVSRGMDSLKLKTCELWWNGPKFLMSNQYPQRQIPVAVIKDPGELKNCSDFSNFFLDSATNSFVNNLLNLSNDYFKIIRVLSFICRFVYNCKERIKSKESKGIGPLDLGELKKAEQLLLKLVQKEEFKVEMNGIQNSAMVPSNSQANPTCTDQIMADLPKDRVIKNYPFNVSAVHLDIVTDLTSNAFIATLKRFIFRRGKCAKLYSDNATNFVGANIELKKMFNLVCKHDEALASYMASEGIDWKFLPPRGPNFGGLWEAGVKSFKFYLKRVVEEIPNVKDKLLTSEEQFVETHFQNTYACNSDGRFVVKLPFYKSNSELGDSKPAAISRLLAMERKFKNNPDFEKQYKEFMNEYESLGHMSLVNSRSHTSKDQNFLPHHAVIKPSSPTTKLRVVFDASCKTTNGLLSPCTVFMKIFYQKLWLTKTDWDSPIPQQLTEDWLRFQKAFNAINYLTVPRWVILTADNIVELHGFADASSLAYAAAIYFLSWLSGHPRKWKTFVANRTSEIIEVLPTKHWRHVPSKENPADIASRGIDPKCLPDCKLWWQGPPWLRLETSSWPKAESSCDEASDEIASQGSSISSSHINTTSLTFSETKTAEETIIRWVQDEHGLVRVGGRLQNSQLRFNSKHPIILPSQHSISKLLIKEQHIAHLHAGPTLLAHVLRESHWIVGSRKLINKCIRKCLKCNKFKTSTTTPQLMGNLPKHRVTLERPFFSCGIDYAGPVLIKCNKGRGTKSTKGYIALFVCLATKAVHIEEVGDLTTDSFIAALRRFSARRGAPRHIYSDNGTDFVGAHWHFIPPSSPHFGGIWESGIRSVKFHLKRVLGETILTFEELTTLLTQIEGLLNSRPLSYVNDSDIECISTLTPSHFLTGDVLLSVPEELPSSSNHRDRWELLQNIKRGFWKKWSSEFISSLQPRKKWQDAQPNLKEDDIVLIKEEGPPGTWPMARVLQVHPGNDGLVRVATVKTQDSVFKRPVHKLHKLPIYPN